MEPSQMPGLMNTPLDQGLSGAEAQKRLHQYGPNELEDRGSKKITRILWEQFTAAMVIILLIAALLSAFLGDSKNAAAITAIVFVNALLGFIQEFKAEKAMQALKKMASPQVKVRRDGKVKMISSRDLVPGDIVLLEAGNLVPGDGVVLESGNLRIQEAALTGESEPVEKKTQSLNDNSSGEKNESRVFMGTVVVYGRAQIQILETGMRTELGKIASLMQTAVRDATPLQKRLDRLGKQLALASLALVAVIFGAGLLRGEEPKLMFMTAVSLAVAAIPEGLPAVVTIALALGAQRMLKRKALIRKLPAVETLGSVTVICSDKTGTLTENRMTVTVLASGDGSRYEIKNSTGAKNHGLDQNLKLLLAGGALCNDAVMEVPFEAGGRKSALGDPTENALVEAAAEHGLQKKELDDMTPRILELPFDSHRKRMTTVHQSGNSALPVLGPSPYILFTKGAMDTLLPLCTHVQVKDRREPLDEDSRKRILRTAEDLAGNGMRVLGLAFKRLTSAPLDTNKDSWERELVFTGLFGMIDPARPEVKRAVETCKDAGIKAVMITGDHPLTAQYIGRELGISESKILTGDVLEKMSHEELRKAVAETSLYARVSPEHKLRIVEALQKEGQIVAMTGDGVNDAPALKKADIGVAMGITGTDVSKEAADMVLLDDNFATIVSAAEEGRIIFDNIRKFIKYLMTTNSSEILVMLLAPFFGMPLPLLPLQILWINLVTDGPTALALGLEPGEGHVMRRAPYAPGKNIFSKMMVIHILWMGLLIALLALGTGFYYWRNDNPCWQTLIFTASALMQMGQALAIRSTRDPLHKIGLFSNKALLAAVACTVLLQMAVVYMPLLQGIFKTVPLTPVQLLLCAGLGFVIFLAAEMEKIILRKKTVKPA